MGKGINLSIWSNLNNFNPYENWGDKNKVNGLLILLLDKITDEIKVFSWNKYRKFSPCIVHCAFKTNGHSPNSQHYLGNAVDFHFENIRPLQAYKIINKTIQNYQAENFIGLGIYPDWYKPGFHLDIRGYKARWSKIAGKYTKLQYGLEKVSEDF